MIRYIQKKEASKTWHFVKYSSLAVIFVAGLISIIATNGPNNGPVLPPHWTEFHEEPIGSPSYSGIWGAAPNDIWVFGHRDSMMHWDGSAWSRQAVSTGASNEITDMWGSSGSDIWVIGDISTGEVLHWNGSAWARVSTPNAYPGTDYLRYPLHGVGGSSANDVWIVGEFRKILHWNGSNWSVVGHEDVQQSLFGVYVLSSSDAWAVGNNGTILHWNGSAWSSVTSGTTKRLYGVWGASANDVWAAGDSGLVLHWNGSSWSSVTSDTDMRLENIWGSGANDVWAVGRHVIHWDGTAWTRSSAPGSGLRDVWTSQQKKAWGIAGRKIWRYE